MYTPVGRIAVVSCTFTWGSRTHSRDVRLGRRQDRVEHSKALWVDPLCLRRDIGIRPSPDLSLGVVVEHRREREERSGAVNHDGAECRTGGLSASRGGRRGCSRSSAVGDDMRPGVVVGVYILFGRDGRWSHECGDGSSAVPGMLASDRENGCS